MNDIYVFDIDGTLSDNAHRVHYLENGRRDWDSFFKEQENDTIKYGTVQVLKSLWRQKGNLIVLLTGREEKHRNVTIKWLRKYEIPYDELIMRPEGSREGDDTLKIKQLEQYVRYQNCGIVRCIFEDRKRVVESFRKKGYLVHHVDQGDF